MSEAFQTDSVAGLTIAANAINLIPAAEKLSKFVKGYCVETSAVTAFTTCTTPYPVAATNWVITIGLVATSNNGIPTGLNSNTILLAPNVNSVLPVSTSKGAIDWACMSATNSTAKGRALGNGGTSALLGSLPGKYAPSECR